MSNKKYFEFIMEDLGDLGWGLLSLGIYCAIGFPLAIWANKKFGL